MEQIKQLVNELLKISGINVSKEKIEDEQILLIRIAKNVDAACEKNEDVWSSLSIEAQEWMNSAVRLMNTGSPLPTLNLLAENKESKKTPKAAQIQQTPAPISTTPLPPEARVESDGTIRRRNLWGIGTTEDLVLEMLIETQFASISPVTIAMAIRNKGGKIGIATAEARITSILRVFGALHRAGWLDEDVNPDKIVKRVEAINDAI